MGKSSKAAYIVTGWIVFGVISLGCSALYAMPYHRPVGIGRILDMGTAQMTVAFKPDNHQMEIPCCEPCCDHCVKAVAGEPGDIRAGDQVVLRMEPWGDIQGESQENSPEGQQNIKRVSHLTILAPSTDGDLPWPPVPMDRIFRGTVVKSSPLVVDSAGETRGFELGPGARITREIPIACSELKAGDLVRIAPDRIVRMASRGPLKREGPPGTLVMPPHPRADLYDRQKMTDSLLSPFGFKDPMMLRVDLFSWYGEYADVMKDLGVNWMEPAASFGFHWNLIQKLDGEGQYTACNWERQDRMVRHAQANNLNICGIVHAAAPYAGEKRRVIPSLPDDLEGYRRFVSAVVERYDGDGIDDMPGLLFPIRQWKVEDEAMAKIFWNGTGADYAVLLTQAYGAIKRSDKNAVVICSMVRGYPGLGKNPRDFMLDFYERLSGYGHSRPYDIMDQHWMVTDKDTAKNRQYLQIKPLMADVNATAKQYGFAPSPFYCLETAGLVYDEKSQAIDLVKRYVYGLSCGVKKIFWSGIKTAPKSLRQTESGIKDPFWEATLIREDNRKKAAYFAFKHMVSVLKGSDWDRIETLRADADVYVFRFNQKKGLPVWVAWSDSNRPVPINIRVDATMTRVSCVGAVPKMDTSEQDRPEFSNQQRQVVQGQVAVTLTDVPVFILPAGSDT